jgi:hypothetical protein
VGKVRAWVGAAEQILVVNAVVVCAAVGVAVMVAILESGLVLVVVLIAQTVVVNEYDHTEHVQLDH